MDLFDNLDDFIKGNNGLMPPAEPSENRSASELLDESLISIDENVKKLPVAAKNRKKNGRKPEVLDDSSSEEEEEKVASKQPKFNPVKGQKAAWKRLNKTRDDMAKEKKQAIEQTKQKPKQKPPKVAKKSRNQTNGYVDLTATTTIDLNSDDEVEETTECTPSNLSFDNSEMIVKVKYASKIMEFSLRPYQKFADLIEQMCSKNGSDPKNILLMFKDKVIEHASTPTSVRYVAGLVIYARELSSAEQYLNKGNDKQENTIKLQIQTASMKRPFDVTIAKDELLKSVLFKCSEELKCDPDTLRLEFDGEQLDGTKTADELELEGGEIIDLFMK